MDDIPRMVLWVARTEGGLYVGEYDSLTGHWTWRRKIGDFPVSALPEDYFAALTIKQLEDMVPSLAAVPQGEKSEAIASAIAGTLYLELAHGALSELYSSGFIAWARVEILSKETRDLTTLRVPTGFWRNLPTQISAQGSGRRGRRGSPPASFIEAHTGPGSPPEPNSYFGTAGRRRL